MSAWYRPLELINIPQLYLANPLLWDSIIFLLLFLGLTQFVFVKGKDGRSGIYGAQKHSKFVSIAIALILTFSMVLFEYYTGWYIGRQEVALLPLIILFLILLYFLYSLFETMFEMGKPCSAALSYLITYPALQAMFNFPLKRLSAGFELFEAFLTILIIIAIVTLIMCIVKFFRGADWGEPKDKKAVDPWPARKEENPDPGPSPTPGGDLKVEIESPRDQEEFEQDKPKNNPSIPFKATVSGGSGKFTYIIQYQRIERDSDVKTQLDTRWFGLEERKRQTNRSITRMITELGHEGTTGFTKYNLKVIVKDGEQEASAPVRVTIKMAGSEPPGPSDDDETATIKGKAEHIPDPNDTSKRQPVKNGIAQVYFVSGNNLEVLKDADGNECTGPIEDGSFEIQGVPVSDEHLYIGGRDEEHDLDLRQVIPRESFVLTTSGKDDILLISAANPGGGGGGGGNGEDTEPPSILLRPAPTGKEFKHFRIDADTATVMDGLVGQHDALFHVSREGSNYRVLENGKKRPWQWQFTLFVHIDNLDPQNRVSRVLTPKEMQENGIAMYLQRTAKDRNVEPISNGAVHTEDSRELAYFSKFKRSTKYEKTLRVQLIGPDEGLFEKLGCKVITVQVSTAIDYIQEDLDNRRPFIQEHARYVFLKPGVDGKEIPSDHPIYNKNTGASVEEHRVDK